MKKSLLFSFLFSLLFISLFTSLPESARADQFDKMSSASIFTSLFSKVKSFLAGEPPVETAIPHARPPAIVQTSCIPPVPPKPAGMDSGARYGFLTVTPEISTAGPNNIITLSATTNLETTETLGGINFVVPIVTNKDDLLDWYPKDPSVVKFSQFNDQLKNSRYGWGVVNDKTKLPANQTYWVKIRARFATIPEQAKNTTNAHGWKKITYHIGKATNVPGAKGLYIGRDQKPSLVTAIPNYDPKYQTLYGTFSKPFRIVPNEPFEIQTTSLGQAGAITLDVKNAKVIGETKRQVGADETITWKIQPLSMEPVLLQELGLVNSCGEDYFMNPAKANKLSDLDKFKFPIAYDFEKLTADQVNLSIGVRGQTLKLVAGTQDAFHAMANLWTKGETRVPVPSVPITFRAVYADNPRETAVRVVFKSYGSEKEYAGEITVATIKERNNSSYGSALVRVVGSKLTDADAKRGIVLKATATRFPGLAAEMTVPVVASKPTLPPPTPQPQPKPEPKPKPIPTPVPPAEKKTKIKPINLVVTPSRKAATLTEGDSVVFKASLMMSDGSLQPATDVAWRVIGKIGSITPVGIFEAKLDESIAEYGEGIGVIVATYTDAAGAEFIGRSETIRVETALEDDGSTDGALIRAIKYFLF